MTLETVFQELKRFARFEADDEAALRTYHPHARPHFARIAEAFYDRLHHHEEARAVFSGPTQVARLKRTLVDWMELLCAGPWDEAYYERRARIGRMHVKINLPQRYMFVAMNVIRLELTGHVATAVAGDEGDGIRRALDKILDVELAIMLESYREAFVDKAQLLERLERQGLERRLAISEARYEEIVEKGEALISTLEPDGRIVLFNRRCEELTGLTRDAAAGRSWLDIFVAEAERTHVAERFEQVLSGDRVGPYEGPITSGERRVRWHFTTLPGPSVPLLCGIGLDVTDEHDMMVRTRRAERLAALGTMAAGLAHEIRNPLNAAHLQLALVQRRLTRQPAADVDGAAGATSLAISEMKRLADLVTEFLQFARPQPLRPSRVDLRSTVETIVQLVGPEAAAVGCELSLIDGEPVPADVDDERIKQVILNLVKNAIEAAGHGGHVQVEVSGNGELAHIAVVDDGPGLPSQDAPIFEPFYTTKETGTGLGLAIVHRIVSDHAGRVNVSSRPGRTLFSVSVPIRHC